MTILQERAEEVLDHATLAGFHLGASTTAGKRYAEDVRLSAKAADNN
jgi:hypothetical protein